MHWIEFSIHQHCSFRLHFALDLGHRSERRDAIQILARVKLNHLREAIDERFKLIRLLEPELADLCFLEPRHVQVQEPLHIGRHLGGLKFPAAGAGDVLVVFGGGTPTNFSL